MNRSDDLSDIPSNEEHLAVDDASSSFPVHTMGEDKNETKRKRKKKRDKQQQHPNAAEQHESIIETKLKEIGDVESDEANMNLYGLPDSELRTKRKKRKKREENRGQQEALDEHHSQQSDPSLPSTSNNENRKHYKQKHKNKAEGINSVDHRPEVLNSIHSHYEAIDDSDFISNNPSAKEKDEKIEEEEKKEETSSPSLEEKRSVSSMQPKSMRQNGIYVENPVSGQFNRMRNFQEACDELLRQEESDNEEEIMMGEEIDKVNFEMQTSIRQVHSNLAMLICLMESLLSGFSLLILLASFVPSIKNFKVFIGWYAPLAGWCEKIFHIVATMSLVSSIYMLLNELSPMQKGGNSMNLSSFFSTLPDMKSKNQDTTDDNQQDGDLNRTNFQKVRDRLRNSARTNSTIVLILGIQCVVYCLMYFVVLGNLVQEDYFAIQYSKHSDWLQNLPSSGSAWKEFEKRVIIWHVLNIIRCLCAVIGWMLSLLLIRINRHIQNQSEYSLYKLRLEYDGKLEQLFRLEQYFRLREENDIIYSSSLHPLKTTATNGIQPPGKKLE